MKNVIVVGKGPAGITSAIYLKRANIDVSIVSSNESALLKTNDIENYYGFTNISGIDLLNRGYEQAKKLGIEIIDDEITDISKSEKFEITGVKSKYFSTAVILCTGQTRKKPNILNIDKYEGQGISYCAVCDAFFYRNKDIAVIGSGNYALHEAEILKAVARNVTILTNGENLTADFSGYDVITKKITAFLGDEFISSVSFEDGSNIVISGAFIAINSAGSADFALKLGCATRKNEIIVDDLFMTNIEGFFAAGDCIKGIKQICKATSDGAGVALAVTKYIRTLK